MYTAGDAWCVPHVCKMVLWTWFVLGGARFASKVSQKLGADWPLGELLSPDMPTLRKKLYESVEVLQRDLDEWLYYYNRERPHQGYRNMGRRPIERIDDYLETVREEG